jgi:hypothetical protein
MVAGFTSEQRPASGSVPPAGFVGIPILSELFAFLA